MDEDFNVDDDDEGGGAEWLATYGDLVTLLLCFFVLLFAMSTIDNIKFRAAMSSFSSMNVIGSPAGIAENTGDSVLDLFPSPNVGGDGEMEELYREVKELLNEEGLSGEIDLQNLEKGVMLVVKNDVLFDQGKADLRPEMKDILSKFASILKSYNKRVRVEGHTDNVPISNSRYASNWELSTARAISVVKYFTEGVPVKDRISAKNFEVAGLSEFSPVAPNDTAANKQKNRRIEIIILK